ncbi:hypothetical protein [Acrocarpospora catenulata]|uniref:hypothetical protein n=1 Tax=Acrocarpospora catenulata TaxID=2836182 RepID=UPI001BD9DEB2|nr:hypothetical protein [Acrocarpospora catenulata]
MIELADLVENELLASTPEDIEPIAAAMITLGAVLHTATAAPGRQPGSAGRDPRGRADSRGQKQDRLLGLSVASELNTQHLTENPSSPARRLVVHTHVA